MKVGRETNFEVMSVAVARIPLLPTDVALRLYGDEEPLTSVRNILESSEHLLAALWLSTPSLYNSVKAWLDEGKPFKNRLAGVKTLMYLARMSARTTPYGMFAGVGAVGAGDSTTLSVTSGYYTKSRLDMGWLYSVLEQFECNVSSRRHLLVYANDMLLERGNRVFVFNPLNVDLQPTGPEYARISLNNTPGVAFVREIAQQPVALNVVAEGVAAKFGCDIERANAFVEKMWDAGILLPAARPCPLDDPLPSVLEALSSDAASDLRERLRDHIQRLREVDALPIEQRTGELYEQINSNLQALSDSVAAPVQVDLGVTLDGTLSREVLRESVTLARLSLRLGGARNELAEYREAFTKLYEGTERLVPLLELVDSDFGLGRPPTPKAKTDDAAALRHEALLRIAADALRDGSLTVVLNDEQLEAIIPPDDAAFLPDTCEIGFFVDADSKEQIDAGNFLIACSPLIGTNAAYRSIGRFAHLFDASTIETMRDELRQMCTPEKPLICELVYAPAKARAANVATRPSMVDAQLELGFSSAHALRISPADVLVGLRNGRFYLWSRSLSREIDIRESHVLLTSTQAPSLGAFLSMLIGDGKAQPGPLDWGPASNLPFLPRLQYGRIVLSTARWRIDLAQLQGENGDEVLRAFRERYNVPEFVFAVDGDNRVPVRLTHPMARDILVNSRRDKSARTVILSECFPRLSDGWLDGPQGKYIAEFVVSVRGEKKEQNVQATPPRVATRAVERRRGLDSDWAYAKLYAGGSFHDSLFSECASVAKELRDAGALANWFALRYADPREHIRLRLQAQSGRKKEVDERLRAFIDSKFASGDLLDAQLACYNREVERYGGSNAIEIIEQIFNLSSEIVASELRILDPNDALERVERAVITSDLILRPLIALAGTAQWVDRSRSRTKARLDSRLSASLRDISQAIHKHQGEVPMAATIAATELVALNEAGALEADIFEIISALFHMHCNRFGVGGNESVARVLQWKAYASELARQQGLKPVAVAT